MLVLMPRPSSLRWYGQHFGGRSDKYRAEMTVTRSDIGLASCGTICADGVNVNDKRYFRDNVLVSYEIRTGPALSMRRIPPDVRWSFGFRRAPFLTFVA
jgi:hypothetical protein